MDHGSLISQDELDTLTSSIHIAREQTRAGKPAQVALYDFENAAQLPPDQFHALADKCELLATVLTRTLTAYLNSQVSVTFGGLDPLTFDQYIRGLPSNPIFAAVDMAPNSQAAWQIDNTIALAFIHTMLGARDLPSSPLHDLTPTEAALLRQLFHEMIDTWTLVWPQLKTTQPAVDAVSSTSAALDIGSHKEAIIHAAFRFDIEGLSGPSNLALPIPPFKRLLHSRSRSNTNSHTDSTSLASPTATHALNSTVSLRACLANLQIPLSTLTHLATGDVIPLNVHLSDPVHVIVSGMTKFLAQPGRYNGHLAVRLMNTSKT